MLLNMIKNNQFDKLIEFISENPIVADQKLPIVTHLSISDGSVFGTCPNLTKQPNSQQ